MKSDIVPASYQYIIDVILFCFFYAIANELVIMYSK